jgi:hypothetical protein
MRLQGLAALGLVAFVGVATCSGQVLKVNVIKRQSGETAYDFSVPGRSDTTTQTHVKCTDGSRDVNCIKTTTTETQYQAPVQGSYSVTGATLSLLLPDGRIAVANCVSKFNWTPSNSQPQRSCRVPPIDDIQVEFKGNSAKLEWSVSVDGSKMDSETYKIWQYWTTNSRQERFEVGCRN